MIATKRLLGLGLVVAAALSASALWPVAADSHLSREHQERISVNCVSAQNTLTQLHANDALLRVNRGQIYEAVSVKLMAPMNSRIALNRLDGSALVDITADYDKELADFRDSYKVYERHLSEAMKTNCVRQPADFYDRVQVVRADRTAVHDHVLKLHEYIRSYQTAFDDFAADFRNREAAAGD